MEYTINQRIGLLIDRSGISLTAYAKLIGVAQTSLRDCVKNGAEPKFSTLNKIIIANPLISSEWLLTGFGDIEKSTSLDYTLLEEMKEEIISLKSENRALREVIGLGDRKESGNKSA